VIKLGDPAPEASHMRVARPAYEVDDIIDNDPRVQRDKAYAELQNIARECEKLAVRARGLQSGWRRCYCRSVLNLAARSSRPISLRRRSF
jgi:hypothetical protein